MTFSPSNTRTSFLPLSSVFPENEEQLLIVHTNNYNSISRAVNLREIGQYETVEVQNGQFFFNTADPQFPRQGFRKVFPFGAIAAGAALVFAHGITNLTEFTYIGGTFIADNGTYRPLPFVATGATNQQTAIYVDATNITIVNGAAANNIVSGIVVLNYLKQ